MARSDTQFGGPKGNRPGRPPLTEEQREAAKLLALNSKAIVQRALEIALKGDTKEATPVLLKLLDKLAPDLLDSEALASPLGGLTLTELQALAKRRD